MQGIKFKTNKQQFDLKKSLSKLFDYKRDCFSRLRALKSICDAKEIKDVKETFTSNYSVIYSVFHETFVILDSVKFNGHRKNTTEDDRLLFYIFEKILILLPEKLEKKWQMNSLIFIFRKCLQPNNLLPIRLEAMRLFLIYYQILGEINVRQNPQIEFLYASLIPGIVLNDTILNNQYLAESPLIDPNQIKYYGIRPFPIEPFIINIEQSLSSLHSNSSSSSGTHANNINSYPNYEYKQYTKIFFTQHLLDFSISQCAKIYWLDHRERRHLRGFEFLFSSFARIYLPYIFPVLAAKNPNENEWNDFTIRLLISIYHPPNELPKLRRFRDHYSSQNEHVPFFQAVVIQWIAKYLLGKEGANNSNNSQTATLTPTNSFTDSFSNNLSKYSNSQSNLLHSSNSLLSQSSSLSLFNQSSSKTLLNNQQNTPTSPTFDYESELFRLLLNSRRFYVDLILNLFHQSFLWPFHEDLTTTMRDVIKVFRQWIYKEIGSPLPLFLAEPTNNIGNLANSPLSSNPNLIISSHLSSNDDNVCAGYMNMMNIFIMSSSNVFLLEVPSEMASILDKQVDVSKRVFNIYRYMVMKIEMERSVWENLVQVLIRVTECIISTELPAKRDDNLGGRLAPALFQTLVVTWIKANLNIQVSNQLWEQFHQLVSSLTKWEELISEWSNTMFILNRVMSRYVFHINLNELPMDKTITDRKRELRNKPRLHHIRSVSSAQQSQQQQQQQQSNETTKINQNQPLHSSSNQNNTHHYQQQQQQQHHDQNSRTSNYPDSMKCDSSKVPVQRLLSNDSTSDNINSSRQQRIGRQPKISTPFLYSVSVNRHREYHKNQLINRFIKRSLSDSCLVMTVQQSLCPIRTPAQSKIPFGRRSYKSSSASGNRQNSKKNRHRSSILRNNNLPMIDDEIDEELTIGIGENFDYQPDYYNDNSYNDMSEDIDDTILMNEYYMIDYLKRKTLFRSYSTNDITIMHSAHRHNIVHPNHHHYHQHSGQTNGSDSIADTLSLGASYMGAVGECNSLKETPLTFDSTSAASTCSSSITDQQMSFGSSESGSVSNKHCIDTNPLSNRPVLLGGQSRGWNAEAAAILWRRMLEILGDPNDIPDPNLHRMAFECLAKITEDFTKIRDNITYLNAASSHQSGENSGQLLVPSLHYYTSWLFRATTLPQEYKSGRLLAYKLLCMIAMYRSEQELSKEFLILFYLALKRAILSYEMDLINIIIKYCGSKFFSAALWGSSCLLFHFVSAANVVIGSPEVKTYPRIESLQLLGSLIGFFDVFSNVLCLRMSTDTLSLEPYTDLKDHVIEILIGASKREQTGLGRVISFCSLGIFLYREFIKGSEFNRIKDIINILVAGTRFNNRLICRVACDMLRLIADHSHYLMNKHPDLARRIIEGLCYTFELHIDVIKQKTLLKDFKNLLLCIMFCLSHWCMSVSKDFLLNTFVSDDYPGKILQSNENDNRKYSDESSKNQIKPCLLDLVISLYVSIVNLDHVALVKNQSLNSPTSEALKNSPQVGDMETMDYTIMNSSNSFKNEDMLTAAMSDRHHGLTSSFDQQIENASTLKKAAHLILLHFMNFMGHFPLPKLRTASLSALINENDDNPYVSSAQCDKVDYESLNAPNVLVFTINDTCLMSFVELPIEAFDSSIWTKLLSSASTDTFNLLPAKPIRIIIRNVLGKFAWDSIMLASPLVPDRNSISRPLSSLASDQSAKSTSPDLADEEDEKAMNCYKNSLAKDSLELLVNSIYETTPECRPKVSVTNDDFLHSLNQMPEAVDTLALLINQHFQESQFNEDPEFNNRHYRANQDQSSPDIVSIGNNDADSSNDSSCTDLLDPVKAFQYCRQTIEQFGFLSWEKRKQIELLSKSQSTVRELRHLDNQQFRDQHKIAVIYVGPGQETRESILLNKSGSRAFEEFVSRLGWEVNLATHAGFMGGLQSNLSTGLTAPYYADSFNEVIFHVSTRLEPVNNEFNGNASQQPSIDKQLMNMKMRHLGNDEIHIVWSEHYKEYRRSILATEFGDVLIVIYPLPANTFPNLFRIQIMRKAEVPFFGPLFHGAVVHRDELTGLVRATAINASRGKRLNMDEYKPYFETRYDTIKNLVTKYKDPTIFEEFANRIYAPRYDLLHSEKLYATYDLTKLMDSGFITLEDFIQCTMQPNQSFASIPSTPHSMTNEPTSPASSTMSSEISFSQQQYQSRTPQSPSIQSPSVMDSPTSMMMPFKMTTVSGHHPVPTSASSNSSGTSLRGLRPNSRSSFK
ncbi:ral GTPase-activating protein subunit alpha-1 isoform X2 [Dermatophagoides pteronyssinus]|uniref:Ral GTPase-activating protein subunit alpha-1-like isoform X2 n=1 Tax=Dermatophagoides pteronyssinus TaxID=6956 RepID=A0A6P6YA31_DERPT|nr:ral GTPase-activating protein subunit alpha-1-like isoform X2 [Dermatophagoides pteronyssinus]